MMKTIVMLTLSVLLCKTALAQQLPSLFLVGDSISILYTPSLRADLAHTFNFSRKATSQDQTPQQQLNDPNANGQDSRLVLKYLQTRYAEPGFHPDVVVVNCGLWDIKRSPKTNAIVVDAAEYKANLTAIADLIRAHGAKMVWINTTPVDDARHNSVQKSFFRFNADVVAYNQIASDLFKARGVPEIDLYWFTAQLGPGHVVDHVHFDEPTSAKQAAFIAGFLESWWTRAAPER